MSGTDRRRRASPEARPRRSRRLSVGRQHSSGGWLLGAAALLIPVHAHALGGDEAKRRATTAIQGVEQSQGQIAQAVTRAKAVPKMTPSKRIAAAEVLMRSGDNERAIELFSQVKELHRQGKAPAAADADATFLLGEAYFKTKQYLSARRQFREVTDGASDRSYLRYAGRSISRLVDIALRTEDFESLDDVFARLSKLPSSDGSGSLEYARGKAHYAKGDLSQAKSALGGVGGATRYHHQAEYLRGVIAVKEAAPPPPAEGEEAEAKPKEGAARRSKRYAAAIQQFRKVTRMSADTSRHRHVIDLAWMAIGRLFYESDEYLDAAEAYSHVDRSSPEFTNMLFELAWVYVRLNDYARAQRALEVLSIADPKSMHIADGSLLRADLMLRSGKFDRALALYQSVRSEFDPLREQVDRFLKSTTDPAVYYDKLVKDDLEQGLEDKLPPLAIEWAREAAEGDRVFALIDDVGKSRKLVRKSRALVRKLNAALSSPTRAKAFPELKAGLEAAVMLLNRLTIARADLARGMDDANSSKLSGEIGSVRAKRRALMKRLKWLPVDPSDFAKREVSGDRQWNKVSQKLQQQVIEADRLQAMINGLKRVLRDADQYGVVRNADSRQRFEKEIAANEKDLEGYRQRIKLYREAIELGRAQIGFGDQRYIDDANMRAEFKKLLAREVELAAQGRGGSSLQTYARSIQPLLVRADRAEAQIEQAKAKLDAQVAASAAKLLQQVNAESKNLDTYAARLDELDLEARVLVGEVAMRNFALVRDRFKNIVLRADTGVVQHAWEVREAQRTRVIRLQRERAREQKNLDDELREVLDDAGDE